MKNNIKVLDQLLVINLNISIWTARRKLTAKDLNGAELPPDELASLGSKRICDPARLRIFGTLKARAVSLLERYGIRFLSAWAIPENKLDEIMQELLVIQKDFNEAKDSFLKDYDSSVKAWIKSHPTWSDIIANSTVSEDYVRSRIDFKWQTYKVMSPNVKDVQDGLKDEVASLGNTLFDEIARDANTTWEQCYKGKSEVTRRALSPLNRMYEKLIGLSFVEPKVNTIAEMISTALSAIPKRGPIKGGNLCMLQGLVAMLRTPVDLFEHSQKLIECKVLDSSDILKSLANRKFKGDGTESQKYIEELPPILDSHGLW